MVSAERYREEVDPTRPNSAHAAAIRMAGRGHRVLEVGCSVGHVTEHLAAAGNVVTGIEIDPVAADEARQHASEVHVADLDRTPLGDLVEGPFDVIMFGDVLEHLREPDRVLADACRFLADDGRFVISIPNVAHADVRLMLLEGRWQYREHGLLDDTHLRFFTREGLHDLLNRCDLVATAIERVTCPIFESNLPVTPELHGSAIRSFVLTDPEALTFQFIVSATRRAHIGDAVDVLDRRPPAYPAANHERDELELELREARRVLDERDQLVAAMQAELDAWRNSTLARVTRPLRAVWAPISRRLRR